jgi:polyribonucleotide 5'-hydroxyl-kinase
MQSLHGPTNMITLLERQEFRFELDEQQAIAIKLVSGTAECFGLELAVGVAYPFGSEAKAAIFTWTGCELEMSLP